MSNIRKQLNRLNVSKLRLKNGNTVERELKKHAAILADCIMSELDAVYSSYSPSMYQRTYRLYDSIYIDDVVKISIGSNGTALSMSINFDDGAIHLGIMGESANMAVLMNEGWHTHGSFANVPYFGFREGTHFIEKGIERYKAKVSNPFEIRLNINGVITNM